MKQTLFIILLSIILVSWKADLKGPWIRTENGNIILYTRPLHFTKTTSPDSITIQQIIQEQNHAIEYINYRLKTHFDAKVEIFLFNYDEAKEKIGTNGGGFASLRKSKKQIYFTFSSEPIFNPSKHVFEYVGSHEMVHIITTSQLGRFKTSFFGEGYSNAIDGNYGSKMLENVLSRYNIDSSLANIILNGKLLSPSELLYNNTLQPRLYYPQVGCLLNWLFDTYGAEKINKLYGLKRRKIENASFEVTGVRFDDMEKQYLNYRLKIE